MNVTVAELKARLSEILRKAAAGEEVVVTRHGRPYVQVIAEKPEQTLPRVGAYAGRVRIADDFDELGPEWDEYIR